MAEVPQIVRERLRRQAKVGEHPDANLLSAFAERALTEQERAPVLDHLSRCAECREIMALSAPEAGEERPVVPASAPSSAGVKLSWWQSPVVHWGALTAAALVVLIAVGERMRLREGHSASAPAVAKSEPVRESTAGSEAATDLKLSRKPVPLATPGGASPSAVAANAPPPPPAALPMKPHDFNAGNPSPPSSDAFGQAQAKAAIPAPLTSETLSMEAAAPAVSSPRQKTAGLSQHSGATLAKRASLAARWSISDSGAVQRSFDGGRSWKEIAVADGVTFRAVATLDNNVWAGGSSGALYHSADGGEHWSQVLVGTNGRSLSGDIVRIEFADTQTGLVTTATGEAWVTSDSGATWHWR